MENMKNIQLNELFCELKALGIPNSIYSLGYPLNERICLVFSDKKWLVYYSEKGQLTDLKIFDHFIGAKNYFLDYVQDH